MGEKQRSSSRTLSSVLSGLEDFRCDLDGGVRNYPTTTLEQITGFLMHLKFRNVNSAFRGLVQGIHTGEIPTVTMPSRVGEVLQVEEPVIVSYSHPRERVLFNPARDANCFFHLYESLWMLAGRNDVAPLNYYASDYGKITSDDGVTANGAYGYRWRHAGQHVENGTSMDGGIRPFVIPGEDQLRILIEHLRRKPQSRRAVLQMWNVEDDLLRIDITNDVCCNLSVMFSIENGTCKECSGTGLDHPCSAKARNTDDDTCPKCKGTPSDQPRYLNITVTNRSNDLIWGMLGANVVHFSFLQEYVAAHLGLDVGTYNQITNNLHVYTERWEPEKWLADDAPDYYSDVHMHKGRLVCDPSLFDTECARFVESWHCTPQTDCVKYSEPFLQNVAQPMMSAFHYHKLRYYKQAGQELQRIKADDWAQAAGTWIHKRQQNWERKNVQSETVT